MGVSLEIYSLTFCGAAGGTGGGPGVLAFDHLLLLLQAHLHGHH